MSCSTFLHQTCQENTESDIMMLFPFSFWDKLSDFFKLNNDLWDNFVHFNLNSATVDDNNKKFLKLTWVRLNTTNSQKDQYQRSSFQ